MKNQWEKAVRAIGAILAALLLAGGVGAPGRAETAGGQLMQNFSAADVSAILGEFEIAATVLPYDEGVGRHMKAVTPGGGVFIMSFYQCDDYAATKGCTQAVLTTAFSNAGRSYDDLNDFHIQTDVTRAVNLDDKNAIVLGAPIYAHGGIGSEHLKLLIALYLNDVQSYADLVASGATSVAFRRSAREIGERPQKHIKFDQASSSSAAPHMRSEIVMKAAIANTYKVQFVNKPVRQIIDERR